MRQVIESYAIIFLLTIMTWIAIAFTSINMHTIQARRIYADLKSEIQASNGALVPESGELEFSQLDDAFRAKNNYGFKYKVTRQSIAGHDKHAEHENYVYSDIYKISFVYVYNVPLFGQQVYPISGFAV